MEEIFAIPGVGGIVEKHQDGMDYILMQNRCKQDAMSEYGLLEIPAGKIRQFENIFECLKREIKEETGYTITIIEGELESAIDDLEDYKVLSYTPFCCAQNIEGKYPILVQIFICQVQGECLIESNESKNIRWIPLTKVKEIMEEASHTLYPMHLRTLEKYLTLKGYKPESF